MLKRFASFRNAGCELSDTVSSNFDALSMSCLERARILETLLTVDPTKIGTRSLLSSNFESQSRIICKFSGVGNSDTIVEAHNKPDPFGVHFEK